MSSAGRSLFGPIENELGLFFDVRVEGRYYQSGVAFTDKFVIVSSSNQDVIRVDNFNNRVYIDSLYLYNQPEGFLRIGPTGNVFSSSSFDFPIVINDRLTIQSTDDANKFLVRDSDNVNVFNINTSSNLVTFNSNAIISGPNSTTKFIVEDNGGTDLLKVDTVNGEITLFATIKTGMTASRVVITDSLSNLTTIQYSMTNVDGALVQRTFDGAINVTQLRASSGSIVNIDGLTLTNTLTGSISITFTNNASTASITRISTGEFSFGGSIIPSTNNTFSLGASGNIYSNLFTNLATFSSTVTLSSLTASRVLTTNASSQIAVSAVTLTELGYLSGVTSAIQTQINAKQNTITGGASSIVTSNLTANRVLLSDGSGKVVVSGMNNTTFGYLVNVTSDIQAQVNSKQNTITGGATSIVSSNLTINRALLSDASGKVGVSVVTNTELSYLSGVTSALQTQLNGRATLAGTPVFTGIVTVNGAGDSNKFLVEDNAGVDVFKVDTARDSIFIGNGTVNLEIRPGFKGAVANNSFVTYECSGTITHYFWDPVEIETSLTVNNLTANQVVQTNASKQVITSNTLPSSILAPSLFVTGNLTSHGIIAAANNTYAIGNSGNIYTQIHVGQLYLGSGGTNALTPNIASPNAGTGWAFYVGGADRFWVTSNGFIQISSNTAYKSAGSNWTNPSDVRLKKDIELFNDGLEIIKQIQPKKFRYNHNEPNRNITSDNKHVGIIAQELMEIYPRAISQGEDGYYLFDANDMIFLLINAVKQLSNRLDAF